MKPTSAVFCVIFVRGIFINIGIAAGLTSDHWSYGENGNDDNWPSFCREGKLQSPIELSQKIANKSFEGFFKFRNYDKAISGDIQNNGHSIQISVDKGEKIWVSGGGLPESYELEQFHYHWGGSEHTFDSERFPLEAHLVHRNIKYRSVEEALKYPDGIAVLGVLFHKSSKGHKALDKVLEEATRVFTNKKVAVKLRNKIDPESLLPEHKGTFYRYFGSLTTPNCAEAVVWTVFEETLPVSNEQIKNFQKTETEDGEFLKANYRRIQLNNKRSIIYSSSGETASKRHLLKSPFLQLVAVFIYMIMF